MCFLFARLVCSTIGLLEAPTLLNGNMRLPTGRISDALHCTLWRHTSVPQCSTQHFNFLRHWRHLRIAPAYSRLSHKHVECVGVCSYQMNKIIFDSDIRDLQTKKWGKMFHTNHNIPQLCQKQIKKTLHLVFYTNRHSQLLDA